MDFLQIALVFLILLLGVFLSVLGIQVFFILKDLKKSLNKLDLILNDAQGMAEDLQKPVHMVGEVAIAMGNGAAAVKNLVTRKAETKPSKRLFKKR